MSPHEVLVWLAMPDTDQNTQAARVYSRLARGIVKVPSQSSG